MSKQYIGKADLTVVKVNGGASAIYVYPDRIVPDGADADDVKRLVAEGYLTEVGSDDIISEQGGGQGGSAQPSPAGTPTADEFAAQQAKAAADAAKAAAKATVTTK